MSFEAVGVKLVAEEGNYFSTMSKADKAVDTFGNTSKNVFSQMPGLADIAVGAFHAIGTVAVDAFMQAGQAAVGFFTDSIGAAGDFEAGMNRVSIAVGDGLEGTGLKLDDFKKDFLAIGKELPVSTQEVQDSFVELVKGGIDPVALHMGGLKSSIQFATAAELDLTEAAELSARQLGVWTKAGASAEEQAKFLAESQEILVKAANASTVGVKDLAQGMNVAGGIASALNIDYGDFATTMAQIAPAFNSTLEAGTGYKNFLARLQPATNPAKDAMKELGLWTKESGSAFFDAEGKYIGNREAAELLKKATSGLTDAKKAEMFQTIFGNDAMGAANKLANDGAAGYDAMAKKIAEATGVQAAATTMQQGYNTALDNFWGSVEALQITIGSALIPVLTSLFNDYLAPGINTLTELASAVAGDQEAFSSLSPVLQSVVTIIGDVTNGFNENGFMGALTALSPELTAIISVIGDNLTPILASVATMLLVTVVPSFVAWATAATAAAAATIAALLPVVAPIAAIGAAVFVLAKAWEQDWGGIRTTLTDFWNNTGKPIFDAVRAWLAEKLTAAITTLTNFWNDTLMPAMTAVWDFIDTKLIPLFKAIANVADAVLGFAIKKLADYWNNDLSPALQTAYTWFNDNIQPALDAVSEKTGALASSLADKLTPAFEWLNENVFEPVVDWLSQIGDKIQKLIDWLNDLAEKIRNLPSLPSAFQGNSPPPMANWFSDIADQTMSAAMGMQAVNQSIRGMPANPQTLMASAAGMSNATYNQQRSINMTYNTTHAPNAAMNYAIAQALL